MGVSLLDRRRRWNRMDHPPAVLRVSLLASYTVDPLVPYLGIGLHDLGLPPEITVAPFNQIVQQCLDDTAETARFAPDVLVVAPRFEEVWPAESPGRNPDPGPYQDHLLTLADAALAAADRWVACLLFVLPAIPERLPFGVGDHLSSRSVVATATGVRERLRRRLENRPNALVADAEAVVRAIGGRNAHHEALYQVAKIPYTEEVFAALGEQLTRVLRLRYAPPTRAVIIDGSAFAAGVPDSPDPATVGTLLDELDRHGIRVGWHGRCPDPIHLPATVVGGATSGAGDGPPALAGRLRTLLDDWELAPEELVVLAGADQQEVPPGVRTVSLPPEPAGWLPASRAAGLFDRFPPSSGDVAPAPGVGPTEPAAPPGTDRQVSLTDYIASLNVTIDWRPAGPDDSARLAEMLIRTKDFTLGLERTEADLAAALAEGTSEIRLAQVRDRFGDYGLGAAIGVRQGDAGPEVDLLLVSCPALGKGVEEVALREILELLPAAETDSISVPYRDTGRNGLAIEFLRRAAATGDEPHRRLRLVRQR